MSIIYTSLIYFHIQTKLERKPHYVAVSSKQLYSYQYSSWQWAQSIEEPIQPLWSNLIRAKIAHQN